MSRFLLRRIFLAIPVLFGILLVTFGLVRAIPGDPCVAQLGERATEEICNAYFIRWGLDQPVPVQFFYYVGNVFRGDLGTALRAQVPVTQVLAERLPTTIELTIAAIIFSVIVGIPLGIISAYRQNSFIDVITMMLSNVGVSMPVFWLGLMLMIVFAVLMQHVTVFQIIVVLMLLVITAVVMYVVMVSRWRKYAFGVFILVTIILGLLANNVLPLQPVPFGETEIKDTFLSFLILPPGRGPSVDAQERFYNYYGLVDAGDEPAEWMEFVSRFTVFNAAITFNWDLFGDAVRRLILPAIAVGTIPLSIIARMTRSSLLDTLGQDYVRTARAKGLREFVVVMHHALKNALLPVVTIIGLNFGGLISGAVLTETVFSLTGIGKTLFEGITARDYPVVQGVTLVTAVAFVVINLVVDILYAYLDPRVRLE
jgi:peptide/nickel transport system permease protein